MSTDEFQLNPKKIIWDYSDSDRLALFIRAIFSKSENQNTWFSSDSLDDEFDGYNFRFISTTTPRVQTLNSILKRMLDYDYLEMYEYEKNSFSYRGTKKLISSYPLVEKNEIRQMLKPVIQIVKNNSFTNLSNLTPSQIWLTSKRHKTALFVRFAFSEDLWFTAKEVQEEQFNYTAAIIMGETSAIATYLARLFDNGYLDRQKSGFKTVKYRITDKLRNEYPLVGQKEFNELISLNEK